MGTGPGTQKMARQAFGLLLELRQRQDARQALAKALAYLEVLAREKDVEGAPVILSISLLPLRKNNGRGTVAWPSP